MDLHDIYIHRCIELARLGAGHTAPNPMVGAVLLYKDRIIGEGYHAAYGGPHAEVNCINSVSPEQRELISQSTLYVSLEPCAHFGKTPPCSDLIIREKIPQVVTGCRDSFSEVAGKGIDKLKAAGIKVITGVLERECRALNKRFFTFHEQRRPYIILKWAQTGNAKISGAGGKPVKISNGITDRLMHKQRAEEAAIFAGANTIIQDDPLLTARLWKGKQPVRISLDEDGSLPLSSRIFDGAAPVIILNRKEEEGIFFRLEEDESLPAGLCRCLYEKGLSSVIIEGGRSSLQAFIDAGCWDEAVLITNNSMLMPEGTDAPVLKEFNLVKEETIFTDHSALYRRTGNEFL